MTDRKTHHTARIGRPESNPWIDAQPEYRTSIGLTPTQLKLFTAKNPGYSIIPNHTVKPNKHGCEALERDLLENLAYYSLHNEVTGAGGGIIVDVGGNAPRHARSKRNDIHCCNPILDAADVCRRGGATHVNTCEHKAPDCFHITGADGKDPSVPPCNPAAATMSVYVYVLTRDDILRMVHATTLGVHVLIIQDFLGESYRGSQYGGEAEWVLETRGGQPWMRYTTGGGSTYDHCLPTWVWGQQSYSAVINGVMRHMCWQRGTQTGYSTAWVFRRADARQIRTSSPRTACLERALADKADYGEINLAGAMNTKTPVFGNMSLEKLGVTTIHSLGKLMILGTRDERTIPVPKAFVNELAKSVLGLPRDPATFSILLQHAKTKVDGYMLKNDEVCPTVIAASVLAFHKYLQLETEAFDAMVADNALLFAAHSRTLKLTRASPLTPWRLIALVLAAALAITYILLVGPVVVRAQVDAAYQLTPVYAQQIFHTARDNVVYVLRPWARYLHPGDLSSLLDELGTQWRHGLQAVHAHTDAAALELRSAASAAASSWLANATREAIAEARTAAVDAAELAKRTIVATTQRPLLSHLHHAAAHAIQAALCATSTLWLVITHAATGLQVELSLQLSHLLSWAHKVAGSRLPSDITWTEECDRCLPANMTGSCPGWAPCYPGDLFGENIIILSLLVPVITIVVVSLLQVRLAPFAAGFALVLVAHFVASSIAPDLATTFVAPLAEEVWKEAAGVEAVSVYLAAIEFTAHLLERRELALNAFQYLFQCSLSPVMHLSIVHKPLAWRMTAHMLFNTVIVTLKQIATMAPPPGSLAAVLGLWFIIIVGLILILGTRRVRRRVRTLSVKLYRAAKRIPTIVALLTATTLVAAGAPIWIGLLFWLLSPAIPLMRNRKRTWPEKVAWRRFFAPTYTYGEGLYVMARFGVLARGLTGIHPGPRPQPDINSQTEYKAMAPTNKIWQPLIHDATTREGALHLTGIGVAGYLPTVFASNVHNEIKALNNRALLYTPENPAEIRLFRQWIKEHWSTLLPGQNNFAELQPTPWAEWLSQYPLALQKRYTEARERLRLHGANYGRIFRRGIFVKREKLVTDTIYGREHKDPRAITKAEDEYQVCVGPWMHAFSKALMQLLHHEHFIHYAASRTNESLGAWFDNANEQCENPVWAERDCSRWDATIGPCKIEIEVDIFMRFGAHRVVTPCGMTVLDMVVGAINTKGTTSHGVNYYVEATRHSGDFWTSSMNSLINGLAGCYVFCMQANITPDRIHSAGGPVVPATETDPLHGADDGAGLGLGGLGGSESKAAESKRVLPNADQDDGRDETTILRADYDVGSDKVHFFSIQMGDDDVTIYRAELAIDWDLGFTALGFRPKCKLRTSKFDVEFCSSLAWPTDEGTVFGPKPGRFIAKAGYIVDKPEGIEHGMLRGIMLGVRNTVAHVPIAHEWCEAMLALAPDEKDPKRKRWNQVDYRAKRAAEWQTVTVRTHAYNHETWEMFNHRYGMSPATVADIAELLANIQLGEVIEHPALRAICDRDLDVIPTVQPPVDLLDPFNQADLTYAPPPAPLEEKRDDDDLGGPDEW